jgi:hypothetical protein
MDDLEYSRQKLAKWRRGMPGETLPHVTDVRALADRILLECKRYEMGEVPSIMYADTLCVQALELARIGQRIAHGQKK